MKRALCIWLPNWPLQRLAAARAELKGRGVVLYELHASGGAKVVAFCPCLGEGRSGATGGLSTRAASPGCHAHAGVSMPDAHPGIRPGMPLAEATALAGSAPLHLEPVDPVADRLALEELAEWCRQFSPSVGLEEAPPPESRSPESLLLDATGLGPLFDGEEALARHVVGAFQNRGLAVRVAIADTLGAAWAVAHFACHAGATAGLSSRADSTVTAGSGLNNSRPILAPLIIPSGQSRAALASLPPAALRLPAETCGLLADLGLRRIDELTALRRETLLARFGPLVLKRLDQAHGAALEAIAARPLAPEWTFEWLFEHPTSRGEAIRGAVDRLVARACAALACTRQGMLRLECRFEPERGPSERVVVGFYRPSASVRHVGDVVHLKLERLSFREPLAAIRLDVPVVDRLEFRQREFFAPERNREAPRELAMLVDRLTGRLGSHAVLRPWFLADAQPEFACQYQPFHLPLPARAGVKSSKKKSKTTRKPRGATYVSSQDNLQTSQTSRASLPAEPDSKGLLTPGPSPVRGDGGMGDRPLCLEREPRRLAVLAVAPEGPPVKFQLAGRDRRIVRAWGPERIETGWWRGGSVRRDYYQVETVEGARWWLFRELATGRWFLHGNFA